MIEERTELEGLESLSESLLTGLEDKLSSILSLQQKNFDILQHGRPRMVKSEDNMIKGFLEIGSDWRTREGLRYLASKYAVLEQVCEQLDVTHEDKREVKLDDEERIFIESKILMEELKQTAATSADMIANTQKRIEVDSSNIASK